jgi:hypothetical protein
LISMEKSKKSGFVENLSKKTMMYPQCIWNWNYWNPCHEKNISKQTKKNYQNIISELEKCKHKSVHCYC